MKANKLLGAFAVMACFVFTSQAQEKTITGTVTDQNQLPLPGVNILVQGTITGTQTDFDGNYTIQVAKGQVLVFTYLGLKDVQRAVGDDNVINIRMEPDAQALEEVVVTAQGITRSKKALGYAVTTVASDQVDARPQADIGRALSGKVAGVNITATSGLAGSGTNIIIRGQSSVTQSNQPLFIVDGVPFDSGTNSVNTFAGDAASASVSSRFFDLDPNNIASISVLKGLSATVLYGEQGSNGVILITTKGGQAKEANKKFEASVTQTTFFTTIANLPDYQNEFGGGADLNYSNNFVGNWGPRFDPNRLVSSVYDKPHITPFFPEFAGLEVPYVPIEDNVRDFFRTGVSNTTSVNLSGAGINMNFGHTEEEGFVPGNNVNRTNFSLGGSAQLSNKLSFSGTFNFAISNFETPPAGSSLSGNLNLMARLLFIPRNYDINNLPFQNPVTGQSIYYRTDLENPLWIVENSKLTQNTRRFNNAIKLNYDFSEKTKLTYRLGLDTYTENQEFFVNRGGVSSVTDQLGYLRQTSGVNTIWDHSLILNVGNIEFGKKIGFNGIAGLNLRRDTYDQTGVANIDQIVFGFIDSSNFRTQTNNDPFGSTLEDQQFQNVIGLYGQLEFDYDSYLFLNLSARNDWGSTVEQANRSLFYPSASLSFLPTDAFANLKSDFLNYLKVRAGYGTSAKFPNPFSTRQTLVIGTQQFTDTNGNNVDTNSSANLFANPDLKPELLTEIELGVEARLLKNRIGIDVSIFNRIAEDQILQRTLDNATGFGSTFINAGEIETDGIEVGLNLTPIQSKNFNWNINANFTALETIVNSLPNDDDRIAFAGFNTLGNFAIVGQPLGVLVGDYLLRDDDGNFLIDNTTGFTIQASSVGLPTRIIGDPNPDWQLNGYTSFSYKTLTLAAQVEYTHGGDVYSATTQNLLRRGVTEANVTGREELFIIPGTLADPNTGEPILDASGNTIPNNFAITANDYAFLNIDRAPQESVYDATHLRLRELSLTYNLPSKLLDKTPFGTLSISAIGQNLWFKAFNFPDAINFDPETAGVGVGNSRGLDFQLVPSSKRIGFTVNATF